MSKKRESTAASSIAVNKWRKTITPKEKLDIITQLQKGKRTFNICCGIRLAHSRICTICDNAERIRWTAKLGIKVGTTTICYSRTYGITEYNERGFWAFHLKIKISAMCLLSSRFKWQLFIFTRIHQRMTTMMIMPNHSVREQVDLASSQRYNCIILKWVGKLLLLTLSQMKSFYYI
jgi:hypothetical protein